MQPKPALSVVLFLVLALLVGFLPPPAVKAATSTTYYVAPGGNDNAPGTSANNPFRTINKCAQVMQPGDTCQIESGTYRETITPANSGTNVAPITFQAAPEATVIVSGTEPVSGWTSYSGHIYSAPLSWSLGKENQLFIVNGSAVSPLWEARWPNIKAYNLPELKAKVGTAQSGSATTIVDPELTQPTDFWKGATIWERGGNAYQGMTSKVTGYDSATHTLTYEPIVGDYDALYPRLGSTFFLSGVLGALDDENEWYVDAAAQKVYLWAPGGGAPANVEVKKRKTAFNLNGKSYIHLNGVQTFAANITMSGSNHNVLDGIKAEYVYFSNWSQNTHNFDQQHGGIDIGGNDNVVQNSTIAYSSGTLINIDGNDNRIVNNVIHDGSYMASYDPLVYLSSGDRNLISHNEIRESGRFNIFWSVGSAEIAYNDISNGMWLSRDGALLYSWGADLGNSEIHHNLIHDSKGTDMSVGLYFDNFSENVVVHHNVIYNNDAGIQLNTPGNYRLIYNNTVVNSKLNSVGYWGTTPYKEELYGSRVYNNIFTDAVSLTADTASGYNVTSTAGLNFVNPAAGNYRLSSGSTAINAGAIIPGITDGYSGPAPDAGAYEYSGVDWQAGPVSTGATGETYSPVVTPYMNLIKDSGFEGPKLSDNWLLWTTDGTTTTERVPNSSQAWENRGYAHRLKIGPGGAGVEKKITGLKPNTDYKFVAWVFNTGPQAEAVHLGVFSYGGADIDITSTNTQYALQEISFKTGATNTEARVRIYKSAAATGISYADDTGLIEMTPFNPGVAQTNLKDVQISSPAVVYNAGDHGTLNVIGTQQDSQPADLSGANVQYATSDDNVLKIDGSGPTVSFTALSAGQVTVTATASKDGITKVASQTLTVFPPSGDTEVAGWKVRSYGPNGKGFVTNDNGNLSFVGVGSNVWDKTDDFAFLSKEIQLANPNEKVTISATIDSFGANDPASIGLMLRDQDTADSRHVHFRFDGSGQVLRYVFRNDESMQDALKPPAQQKYWGSASGLLMDYQGKSISAPFQFKLVKEGNQVSGYYVKDGQWLSIGSTTVEFSGSRFLAGIGMYTGAGKPPVKATISKLEVEYDRQLATVNVSADQTTLGASGTAALSVSGTMSDGTLADLRQAAVIYESDNPNVVTVDAQGVVKAVGEGTANVTATVTLAGVTLSDSVQFSVDATSPETTADASQPGGKNGWYTTDATVTLQASDIGSGVAATEFRLGDAGSWTAYTSPFTISDEGIHQVQYRSLDQAGNVEAVKTLEIKMDKTAPVIALQLDKTSIWPVNHKMVTVGVTWIADDSVSGVDSVVLTSITCSDPASSPDDILADLGTEAASISLRAEKDRVYTVTYTATDKAGNQAVGTATVTVPHDQSA